MTREEVSLLSAQGPLSRLSRLKGTWSWQWWDHRAMATRGSHLQEVPEDRSEEKLGLSQYSLS